MKPPRVVDYRWRSARVNSGIMLLRVNTMEFLNLTKLFILALCFCFTMLIFSAPVFACDCAGATGKKALAYADIAFRGTVTNIEFLEPKTAQNEPKIKVTFSVFRVWKGEVETTFILHTTQNSYSCAGYYFFKDKEYLVLAYANDEKTSKEFNGEKNTFGTNPCGATLEIANAKKELEELGKGKKPKGKKSAKQRAT